MQIYTNHQEQRVIMQVEIIRTDTYLVYDIMSISAVSTFHPFVHSPFWRLILCQFPFWPFSILSATLSKWCLVFVASWLMRWVVKPVAKVQLLEAIAWKTIFLFFQPIFVCFIIDLVADWLEWWYESCCWNIWKKNTSPSQCSGLSNDPNARNHSFSLNHCAQWQPMYVW